MKHFFYRYRGILISSIVALLVAVLWMSCGNPPKNNPVSAQSQQQALTMNNPLIQAVVPVQNKYTPELMKQSGVIGTAIGVNSNGKPVILVLTTTDIQSTALAKGRATPIPAKLENVPVEQFVSGKIIPMQLAKGKPGGGGNGKGGGSGSTVSHTAIQTPPIQLGTSGGWALDKSSNGYCCSGTLGSLITDGTNLYILSNYHVLYGGYLNNNNQIIEAQTGDDVIQPGLVDLNCNSSDGQVVATLVDNGGSLTDPATRSATNVDAGIAQIVGGMVDPSGSILEIGTISNSTLAPALNLSVKKSGRTTGLTTSKIIGLNATVSVQYEKYCNGPVDFTQTYTGQIVVSNKGSKFLNSGDSGSLMVENVSTNPRAVGLLFAGSNTAAIANPINDVLDYYSQNFGKTFSMVGQ